MMQMFNDAIFAMMVVAAGGIAASLEVFKKTYLERMLGEFTWYDKYKVFIIRAFAFGFAGVTVLSSNDLSLAKMAAWQPVGTVGYITDWFATSLILSLGETTLHLVGDLMRMKLALKNQQYRQQIKSQEAGNFNA
jgi:hypothetical protein